MSILSLVFWIFLAFGSIIYLVLSGALKKGLKILGQSQPQAATRRTETPFISVLIAARDEEKHLPSLLQVLLDQDYPSDRFEIWVVDDRSQDQTPEMLAAMRQRFPERLRVIRVDTVPTGVSPKKHALSLAMAQAKGDIWVTTDADCLMGTGWLSSLVAAFDERTGLVLGLTTYQQKSHPTFWDKTIALEFASYAFASASLVGLGFPVSGNANNIAYRRQAYLDQAQRMRHSHLVSGDDDFLLQGIHATGQWRIGYALSPDSAVTTSPPDSVRHFWEQRKRWAGKCIHYQPQQLLFLLAIYAYYGCILLGLLEALVGCGSLFPALIFFGVKTAADYSVMRDATKRFGQRTLMQGFVGAALLHIPLILSAVLAGTFGTFSWKGQTFKTKA
jgi:cellulose synthase/poly-beta-1,6-N-acetylglucosamine synthase-like glycosyltransferase